MKNIPKMHNQIEKEFLIKPKIILIKSLSMQSFCANLLTLLIKVRKYKHSLKKNECRNSRSLEKLEKIDDLKTS